MPAIPISIRTNIVWSSTASSNNPWCSPWIPFRVIRWSRAWPSSNAAATARRCFPTSRFRPAFKLCTASFPVPNGQAFLSPACSTKRVSTQKQYRFYFIQEVKSFITHPSPGLALSGPGFYEISGIAYSGNGRISKVMVSADGGQTWAQAALQGPVHSKAFTRFRVPWRWDGGPVVLQSRAWDEAGNMQPTRSELVAARGQTARPPAVTGFPSQHYNAITSWAIERGGEVRNVYA